MELLHPSVELRELGRAGEHTFFGYFDVTPFHVRGERVLAMRVGGGSSPARDRADIGWFDLAERDPQFRKIGATALWCWQQGCRLRWHPIRADNILYNRLEDGVCEAIEQRLENGEIVSAWPAPLYATTSDGRFGFSLDFARLQRLRPGYGYSLCAEVQAEAVAPSAHGITRIDLETGDARILFSVADVAGSEPSPDMEGATHYLNHIEPAPLSSRLSFFHVWLPLGGGRRSRLMVCDVDGSKLRAWSDGAMVSHCAWLSEDAILAFASHGGVRGYFVYFNDGRVTPFAAATLPVDGHPRPRPGTRQILTDTYPDARRDQHLLLVDGDGGRARPLARFFSPLSFDGERRCDLHPRWSADGRGIAVDTAHRGERRLCVLTLNEGA